MSSLPGYDLEDYLAWNFNVVVDDQGEANPSLGIAEALGTATHVRPVLTKEEFSFIVNKFEEFRERVEYRLSDFDENTQSWRDYAGSCFSDLPDHDKEIIDYIKSIKTK